MLALKNFRPLSTLHPLQLIAWLFLIWFAGRFVLNDALPYFGMDQERFGRYWAEKWWLIGHVSGGVLAIAIGPLQFWKGFRNSFPKIHRTMGKIYIISIVVSCICATYMCFHSALAVHWTWAVSLQMLAVAWFTTTLMAFRLAYKKRFLIHREWMIRSYIITFGFATFRWLVDFPPYKALGSFVERGPTAAWLCWVVPLLAAEFVLQWNRKRAG